MRQSAERRDCREMRRSVDADRIHQRERGERIQRVVAAGQRQGVGRHQVAIALCEPLAAAVRHRAQTPLRGVGGRIDTEGHGVGIGLHCHRQRIVAIQHLASAVDENPRLGADVLVEVPVPVEVIRRHVKHGRDRRHQARRRFKLEARQLEHIDVRMPARGLGIGQHFEHWPADVAGNDRREARRTAHCARQRGHRRLAIRSGDRDDRLRRRQLAREQLDVTDDRDVALSSRRECRVIDVETGADRNHVDAEEQRLVPRTQPHRNVGIGAAQVGEFRRIVARIGDDDVGALPL